MDETLRRFAARLISINLLLLVTLVAGVWLTLDPRVAGGRPIFGLVGVIIAVAAVLIASTVHVIRTRLRLERARHDLLTRELILARQIQLKWLPPEGEQVRAAVSVAAINRPASHISGDFYNWFELPDGRVAVLIGDVTGHGMSAAFLMATTQLLVRTTLLRLGDAGACLGEVNTQLCSQAFYGQFVTLLICVLDLGARSVEVATAGHMPPILVRDGVATPLTIEPQLMLGIEPGLTFAAKTLPLPADAGLVLYTDGVPDAKSPDGKRFGDEALLRCLSISDTSATGLLRAVTDGITAFQGARRLPDDLTVVAVHTRAGAGADPVASDGGVVQGMVAIVPANPPMGAGGSSPMTSANF